MKLSETPAWARKKLTGKRVTFKVLRDGQMMERSGVLTRLSPLTAWVGNYCYALTELEDVREVADA